jgi:hypothetical protein
MRYYSADKSATTHNLPRRLGSPGYAPPKLTGYRYATQCHGRGMQDIKLVPLRPMLNVDVTGYPSS